MKLLDLIKKIDKEKELEEILIEGFRLVLTEDNCKVLSKARKSFNKSLIKILEHIVGEGERIEKDRIEKLKNIGCSMCMPPSAKSICNCGAIRMDLKLSIEDVSSNIISPIKQALEEYKGRDKNI